MKWKLKDLTVDGKGSYGIGAPAVAFDPNKYTYLRITDINDDGSLNHSDMKSVDAEGAEKYILEENDIVFARTGNSTGRSYFYEKHHGSFVYAGFLIKFSLDSAKVNPRILKYYTHSREYYDWVKSFDTGGTRGNINAKTFGDMIIDLPERSKQDRIVSILSSLDRKIELNNKINAQLEEMAQAIFKSWFVDFEPFKDGKFVESELGMIPEGWRVGTLGELCTFKRGKNLLSKNAVGGDVPVVAGGLEPACYHNQANTQAPVVTVSGSGANAGFMRMYHVPVWASDCSFIDISCPNFYFVYCFLSVNSRLLRHAQTGAVQPHVKPSDIHDFDLIIPSDSAISLFQEKVAPFYLLKGQYEAENSHLAQLRDTLLPKLMNGEIELPDDDYLQHCKYYKGEAECPFPTGTHAAWYWRDEAMGQDENHRSIGHSFIEEGLQFIPLPAKQVQQLPSDIQDMLAYATACACNMQPMGGDEYLKHYGKSIEELNEIDKK